MLTDILSHIQQHPSAILSVPSEYLDYRKEYGTLMEGYQYPINHNTIQYYIQRTDLSSETSVRVLDYMISHKMVNEIPTFIETYPNSYFTRLGKLHKMGCIKEYTQEDIRQHITLTLKTRHTCDIDLDLVDESNEDTFAHLLDELTTKHPEKSNLGMFTELKNIPSGLARKHLRHFPVLIKYIEEPTFDEVSYALNCDAWYVKYTKASTWMSFDNEERKELLIKYIFAIDVDYGTTIATTLFDIYTPTREDLLVCLYNYSSRHMIFFNIAKKHGLLDHDFVEEVFLHLGLVINVPVAKILVDFVTNEMLQKIHKVYGTTHCINAYNRAQEIVKEVNGAGINELKEFLSNHSQFFKALEHSHKTIQQTLLEKYPPR